MPPPEEITPLMPTGQLNWRLKCYKFFQWSLYFVYFLLLLVDVVGKLFTMVIIILKFAHVKVIANAFDSPKILRDFLVIGIVLYIIDTFICWVFLGIIFRSPSFVGCSTMLKNLFCLPKFWTVVYRFVLYLLGVLLAILLFFAGSSQNREATMKAVSAIEIVMEILNVFSKVVLVVVLNYVQVRNLVRPGFNFRVLKGTLAVVFFSQSFTLIGAMVTVFCSFLLPIATGNRQVQQVGSFSISIMEFFLLPILTSTNELIFTKMLQDNKSIIGKNENNVSDKSNESSSFTRQQNPRDSNTIETKI